jgi:hypothetical protein
MLRIRRTQKLVGSFFLHQLSSGNFSFAFERLNPDSPWVPATWQKRKVQRRDRMRGWNGECEKIKADVRVIASRMDQEHGGEIRKRGDVRGGRDLWRGYG